MHDIRINLFLKILVIRNSIIIIICKKSVFTPTLEVTDHLVNNKLISWCYLQQRISQLFRRKLQRWLKEEFLWAMPCPMTLRFSTSDFLSWLCWHDSPPKKKYLTCEINEYEVHVFFLTGIAIESSQKGHAGYFRVSTFSQVLLFTKLRYFLNKIWHSINIMRIG